MRDIVRGAVRKKSKPAKAKIEEIRVEHVAEQKKRHANARELRKAREEDLAGKIDEILAAMTYLPLDDLQDLVLELGDDLSPSVRDWALALAPAKDADKVSVIDVLKQMLLRMEVLSKKKRAELDVRYRASASIEVVSARRRTICSNANMVTPCASRLGARVSQIFARSSSSSWLAAITGHCFCSIFGNG